MPELINGLSKIKMKQDLCSISIIICLSYALIAVIYVLYENLGKYIQNTKEKNHKLSQSVFNILPIQISHKYSNICTFILILH